MARAPKNNDRLPCRILRRGPFLRAARAPCVLTTLTDEHTMHNECYGYPGVVVNIALAHDATRYACVGPETLGRVKQIATGNRGKFYSPSLMEDSPEEDKKDHSACPFPGRLDRVQPND